MKVRVIERTTLTAEKGSIVEIDASLLNLLGSRVEPIAEEAEAETAKKTTTRKKKAAEQ